MADQQTHPGAPAPPENGMRSFVHVLVNTAFANITTSYLWFGLTFWIYLETENVIATGVIGGAYMLFIALFSMFFGTLVDRFRKKAVMAWATLAAFVVFCLDAVFYFLLGEERMVDLTRPWFWIFAVVMLAGAVVEQLRNIALSTTVTLLVPVEKHANANGLVGTVQGLAFLVTSVFSGLSIGFLGMGGTILIALVAIALSLVHLLAIRIPEREIVHAEGQPRWVDVAGGVRAVRLVPGLLTLILFTTLNNLVGGVYMALMDPYGLEMFSVEMWGVWLAVTSTGFIVGGMVIAKVGLGRNPIRTMLLIAAFIGLVGAVFALREWAWLYIAGMWVYMCFVPAVEAAEQTVIQKVTPYEKQGRVFGFAMTFEAASAPITSFLIAPIAQLWVIPYMRSEDGQRRWSWLLGQGDARGIGLVFLVAGIVAVALALSGFLLPAYRMLSKQFMTDGQGAAASEPASSEPAARDGLVSPVEARAGFDEPAPPHHSPER
ncbi:MFS transporter [Microbacterium oryzae]|uniref:MFS transporter n=1 Tax=Microbacterium oryzae TaxID=743009 RepID=UPI0025B1EDB5|nr:MFS transporter [Microbacterium oryzae]MDN3310811.1 MFS transporter [Microbacterium oryzae]